MRKVCQQDAAKFTGAGALLACQRAAEDSTKGEA
jgi:hypothetical protein